VLNSLTSILAQAGVLSQPAMVVNLVDAQIALVEAGEGIAIVPLFHACVPEPKSNHESANQSQGDPGLLSDPESRQEASTSCRLAKLVHGVPAGLYSQVGRTCRCSLGGGRIGRSILGEF
jgi:hypothetical protein